jgi:hypothetical protein
MRAGVLVAIVGMTMLLGCGSSYPDTFGEQCGGAYDCTDAPTPGGPDVCCHDGLSCLPLQDLTTGGIHAITLACTHSCDSDGDCPKLPSDRPCGGDRQSHCQNKVCQPPTCQ